jgi:hypothetical protein
MISNLHGKGECAINQDSAMLISRGKEEGKSSIEAFTRALEEFAPDSFKSPIYLALCDQLLSSLYKVHCKIADNVLKKNDE